MSTVHKGDLKAGGIGTKQETAVSEQLLQSIDIILIWLIHWVVWKSVFLPVSAPPPPMIHRYILLMSKVASFTPISRCPVDWSEGYPPLTCGRTAAEGSVHLS